MTTLWSFVLTDKYDRIIDLEDSQKEANEKFITTQILSDSLYYVYNMFEKNLFLSNEHPAAGDALGPHLRGKGQG